MGPAPPETVALWCDLVKPMGPDELESFEERTVAAWDRSSLGDLRREIERWRKELAGLSRQAHQFWLRPETLVPVSTTISDTSGHRRRPLEGRPTGRRTGASRNAENT